MKIILLGGSITQGLGSKKINFLDELTKLIPNANILNWAHTGTTIDYALSLLPKIFQEKPDYVVVLYGNTDAQIKPNRRGKIFSHLPKRFQGGNGSMILPRPFYSHKWYKYIFQKIENLLRTIFRKFIYMIDGTEQWVSLPLFCEQYKNLCFSLKDKDISVLCCSTVYIDDNFFPGSNVQYQKYNKEICNQLRLKFLDIYTLFKEDVQNNGWEKSFNCDHFHPNGNGYKLMAKWLADIIMHKEK